MTALTQIAPLAAAALASAIWQSAVLVLCVAVSLRFVPGITAAARSLIWSAVFLLTVGMPFARFSSGGSVASAPSVGLHLDPRWAVAVVAVWACLSALRLVRLLQSGIRLSWVVGRAKPVFVSPEMGALVGGANVSLWTSPDVDVPSVVGFFHRRVLLPEGLAGQIAPADLQQIVLHELEHLRRRDDWTNLGQKLALVVFPLNPVLLWVERRLCVERELACDDGVLRETGGAGKAYATCLANLAEASLLRQGVSLALGAWQRQSELARRVHRILDSPVRAMKPLHSAALAASLLSAVVGTGVLAVHSPELISFRAATEESSTAASATAIPVQSGAAKATFVKALMPQTRLTPAALRVRRKHTQRSRTVAAEVRRYEQGPNVVLIGWAPNEFHARRWTAVSPNFQLTYAAVPTRTGWLFFQL